MFEICIISITRFIEILGRKQHFFRLTEVLELLRLNCVSKYLSNYAEYYHIIGVKQNNTSDAQLFNCTIDMKIETA